LGGLVGFEAEADFRVLDVQDLLDLGALLIGRFESKVLRGRRRDALNHATGLQRGAVLNRRGSRHDALIACWLR
jgi:hypothetical protein